MGLMIRNRQIVNSICVHQLESLSLGCPVCYVVVLALPWSSGGQQTFCTVFVPPTRQKGLLSTFGTLKNQ